MAKAGDVYVAPDTSSSKTSRPKTRDPAQDLYNQQKADAAALEARQLAAQKAAEGRANARADAEKKKTGKRYLKQASTMEIQAKALAQAIQSSFAKNRDQNLQDVSKNLNDQLGMLKEGHNLRSQQFLGAARDTEKATADSASGAFSNMVRERRDALAGLVEQGAGETDSMRAMLMSARNWHSNATESNRGYYDTMRSINTGITDLNVDSKTAMQNAYGAAEQERDRLWTDFYSKRSEAATQYGNIKGQQADYYAMAGEMGVKAPKGAERKAATTMQAAYGLASREAGKSYKQAALPKWVDDWKGTAQVQTRQSNTNLAAAVTIDKAEKPEGASLRKWEG
jgi:hypothetical protein